MMYGRSCSAVMFFLAFNSERFSAKVGYNSIEYTIESNTNLDKSYDFELKRL